jgi:ADP-ribose pyrophosphatase YjhB (NUDIX family)
MEIKLISEKEILSQIGALRNQGFNQIKLPGGTSKGGEHYSGLILFHFDKNTKKSYFLGLPYNPNFYKNNQENIATKLAGETPADTARRELVEETGYFVELEDLIEISNAIKKLPGKIPGTFHIKYFYLVEEFSGAVFEFYGGNPIDAETAAPLWIPAALFKQVLWIGHQEALKGALEILSIMDLL